MAGDDVLTIKDLLKEVSRRFIPPAMSYLIPAAGFLISIVLFSTWLLKRAKSRYRGFSIEEEDKVIAKLIEDIREQEARVRVLEKAREKGEASPSSRVLNDVIKAEKELLENLVTELELRQLRVEAMRKIIAIGDVRITEAVADLVGKIEKGERFEEQQLKVLMELEKKWVRREIEIATLRRLLELER